MSLLSVDFQSRTPIFQQLVDGVVKYVRIGVLHTGDKLPSVRVLTSELGINPNTIQKAYDELVKMNIIAPSAGRGMFVTEQAASVVREKTLQKLPQLKALVLELKQSGLSEEDIISVIKK